MTEFDLELELSAMLHGRSEAMPDAVASDPAIVHRARGRRTAKLAALGGGSAVALALVVGVLALNGNDDNEVQLQPAAPSNTTVTEPEPRVLERGAIVAARANDNVLVELDAAGNELRELASFSEDGGVMEIDPHPNGNVVYVRVAEESSCGVAFEVDLITGERVPLGHANGVAISGDGNIMAFTATLESEGPVCGQADARAVVVRDLRSDQSLEFTVASTDRPDSARNVALNHDGTRLAFEQCWEGCDVRVAEPPLTCISGDTVCDLDIPSWTDLARLAGTGGGVYAPVFVGSSLLAAECDCEVEEPDANFRLVSFDAVSGARGEQFQDLPQAWRDHAIGAQDVLILTTDNTIASMSSTVPTFAGSYAAVALVPELADAFGQPTSAPTGTTTAPTTIASDPAVALAPGAIVVARPDGVIVELDADGNERRELYDAGERVAEIDLALGGASMLVRLGERYSCGSVILVDLVTGETERLGTAAGVAVSGNGRVLAMSAMPTDDGLAGCTQSATAVMVQMLDDRSRELVFPYRPDPARPDDAVNVALNHDGSRLAFEQCWEGCITRLAEIPVDCLANVVDCDLQTPPAWDEMSSLQHDGSGYGAGAYFPTFQGELIVAAVCDCEVEAASSNYRLVSFDAQTGEQVNVMQDFPDGVTSLSVAGDVVIVGVDNTSIIRSTDEPFTFADDFTTVALVPIAAE